MKPGEQHFQTLYELIPGVTGIFGAGMEHALAYALSCQHAVMHVEPGGRIRVWPVSQAPELPELQELVGGYIEAMHMPNLGGPYDSGFLGYANADGLDVLPHNITADLITGYEPLCGPVVILVGFRVDENGHDALFPVPKKP